MTTSDPVPALAQEAQRLANRLSEYEVDLRRVAAALTTLQTENAALRQERDELRTKR